MLLTLRITLLMCGILVWWPVATERRWWQRRKPEAGCARLCEASIRRRGERSQSGRRGRQGREDCQCHATHPRGSSPTAQILTDAGRRTRPVESRTAYSRLRHCVQYNGNRIRPALWRACSTPAGRNSSRNLRVDFPMSHVAETAPFPAPPLDLDDNEHAIRRISTPPVTMGVSRSRRSNRVTVLM